MSPPGPPFEIRLAGLTLQAMRRTLGAAFADRENAPALCQELLARPEEARLAALAEDGTFVSPALGHALLDRAEALFRPLAEGPREALHFCTLAAALGERLPEPWTGLERDSLLGRARSLEGEAHRRRGGLAAARRAQRQAFRHLEALPPGYVERADFCRYLARLRRDQGRDDEALALLARALERFESYPDGAKAQACRLELAGLHLDDLETESALALFERALREEPKDRAGREPERWERRVALRHGLALAYADLRREGAARAVLAELRSEGVGRQGLEALRLKEAEASIFQRLGADEEAAEAPPSSLERLLPGRRPLGRGTGTPRPRRPSGRARLEAGSRPAAGGA